MEAGHHDDAPDDTAPASVALAVEGPLGAVHHDRARAVWAVELDSRGVVLRFTDDQFRDLLRLARRALAAVQDARGPDRQRHRAA